MPVLPGGEIISGIGGRLWIYPIPDGGIFPGRRSVVPGRGAFQRLGGLNPKYKDLIGENSLPFLDISQWSISKTIILAEVPHSGCVGGVTRRVIGQTWRFSASLPLDQSLFPEDLLVNDKFAIAFYLGDVNINPEAIYMNMSQAYYFSPRACVSHINPVLNATGDVIRVNITGEESCRLFLLPNENVLCDRYVNYLIDHKGWL